MQTLGEALRDVLIVGLIIIVVVAIAGAVFISVAIIAGAIFACKDNMEQKKMNRLEPRMIEQAEKGLMEREKENGRKGKDAGSSGDISHNGDQKGI